MKNARCTAVFACPNVKAAAKPHEDFDPGEAVCMLCDPSFLRRKAEADQYGARAALADVCKDRIVFLRIKVPVVRAGDGQGGKAHFPCHGRFFSNAGCGAEKIDGQLLGGAQAKD